MIPSAHENTGWPLPRWCFVNQRERRITFNQYWYVKVVHPIVALGDTNEYKLEECQLSEILVRWARIICQGQRLSKSLIGLVEPVVLPFGRNVLKGNSHPSLERNRPACPAMLGDLHGDIVDRALPSWICRGKKPMATPVSMPKTLWVVPEILGIAAHVRTQIQQIYVPNSSAATCRKPSSCRVSM